MKGRRLAFAWIFPVVAFPACRSHGESGSAAMAVSSDAATASESAVPSPSGILARAWFRSPDAAWARLQHGAGGLLALLPSTTGELVCAATGIDPALAPLVDGGGVSYAVAGEGPGGEGAVSWVWAFPLTDGPRAIRLLLGGRPAEGLRKVGGMRIASPASATSATAQHPPAIGIAPGWLVVGRNEDDVARLGPYAYRSMPAEAFPPSDSSIVIVAPPTALAGPMVARLSSRWATARAWLLEREREERDRHGGRSPDYGDPAGILEAVDAVVARRIAFLAGAAQARVELDSGDDDLHAELRITPGPGPPDDAGAVGLFEAMRPGDARPLLTAPADSVMALLVRDDEGIRADDERWLAATVARVVVPRLPAEAERALGQALERWGRGRGDWMTAGLTTDPSPGIAWVRTPAAPPRVTTAAQQGEPSASGAMRGLVELAGRAAFRELLAGDHIAAPVIGGAEVPGAEAGMLATFPRARGSARWGRHPSAGLAWALRDGDLLAVLGEDPLRLLAAVTSPPAALGGDPRAVRALAALADSVTFTLLAQPLRLDSAYDRRDGAPLVLAWGKRQGDFWARVDLADALVTEMVRRRSTLF